MPGPVIVVIRYETLPGRAGDGLAAPPDMTFWEGRGEVRRG